MKTEIFTKMNDYLRVTAQRTAETALISFWLVERRPHDAVRSIATQLVMTDLEESGGEGVYHPPLFGLTPERAQLLMDDLWAAGIRPSQEEGAAGALAAKDEHLQDMRVIAFQNIRAERD